MRTSSPNMCYRGNSYLPNGSAIANVCPTHNNILWNDTEMRCPIGRLEQSEYETYLSISGFEATLASVHVILQEMAARITALSNRLDKKIDAPTGPETWL